MIEKVSRLRARGKFRLCGGDLLSPCRESRQRGTKGLRPFGNPEFLKSHSLPLVLLVRRPAGPEGSARGLRIRSALPTLVRQDR